MKTRDLGDPATVQELDVPALLRQAQGPPEARASAARTLGAMAGRIHELQRENQGLRAAMAAGTGERPTDRGEPADYRGQPEPPYRTPWLASFPERNPNPIAEVSESGDLLYLNPAARSAFPDLESKGLNHEWLSGLDTYAERLAASMASFSVVEVAVGGTVYQQALQYIPETRSIRIYGLDITTRKRAERALLESESRLRRLTESAPAHIALVDRQGVVRFINREIDGRSPAQIVGTSVAELLPAEWLPSLLSALEECLAGGSQQQLELSFADSQGAVHYWLVEMAPDLSLGGESSAVVTVSDITGLKHAEIERARLTDQLEQERARWKATVECMLDPVTVSDAEGRATYMNPAYSQMIGLDIAPNLGLDEHPVYYRLYKLDGSLFEADDLPLQRAALSGKDVRDAEIVQLGSDGSRHIAIWNASPVRNARDEVIGAVAVGHEVTAQRQAQLEQERLAMENRRQQQFLEQLVKSAPVAIAVVSGPERHLEFANPRFESMVAAAGEKVLGRTLSDVLQASGDLGILELVEKCARLACEVTLDEYRVSRGTGQAARYWDITCTPLLAVDGGVSGALLLAHESTDRFVAAQRERDLAAALQAQRDILGTIMESTQTTIAYLDPNFSFLLVNSLYAAQSGHSKDELLGRNHFALFPNEENERLFRQVRDSGQPITFKAKPFVYADQPERGVTYWDWSLVPVNRPDGTIDGLALSLVDVTHRERERLQREHHLSCLGCLIDISQRLLGETTTQGVLERIAHGARSLTGSGFAVAGFGPVGDVFREVAVSRAPNVSESLTEAMMCVQRMPEYHALVARAGAGLVRLKDVEGVSYSFGKGGEGGDCSSVLVAKLVGRQGEAVGLVSVCESGGPDVSAETEALVLQLAALASSALRNIEAWSDAEHRAAELDAVFAAMRDAVLVYGSDTLVVRANPAAIQTLGFEPVGLTQSEIRRRLLLRLPGRASPDTADPSDDWAADLFSTSARPFQMVDPKGATLTFQGSVAPLSSEGGGAGGVLVLRDVSEREEILGRLATEQARLRAIIEHAPEAIVVADGEGRVLLTNPAANRLCDRPLAPGSDLSLESLQLFYADGSSCDPRDMPLTRSALDGETLSGVEMAIFGVDGSRRDLLVSSAPIQGEHGELSGAVGVFQDITQLEQALHELRDRSAQLETLSQIGLDLMAEFDLKALLRSLMSHSTRLLNMESGAVFLYNPDADVLDMSVSYNLDSKPLNLSLRRGQGVAGAVWESGSPVAVERYKEWPNRVPELTGASSVVMGAPIRWGGEFLGVITVGHSQSRGVEPGDINLLSLLAAQVAIAIRNARLMAGQAEQRRRAEALAKATSALAGTLELEPLISRMLSAAMEATRNADRGAVLLWDPHEDRLRVRAQIGYTNAAIVNAVFSRKEAPLLWDGLDGLPTLVPDTRDAASQFVPLGSEQLPPLSAVVAPLRFRGNAIGVVQLTSIHRASAFSQGDLDLLTTFATAAAGAVENARLFMEAQGKATLEERQRLARALHDSVTQSLYSLTLFAAAASDWAANGDLGKVQANLSHISETAQQALKEMRLLVYELRPSGLQTDGLADALKRRLDAVERRAGIEAQLNVNELGALPPAVEETLFLVALEALNNSLKHAAATSVTVRVLRDGESMLLQVCDDGQGFAVDSLQDVGGLGLVSMRERAEQAGGSFAVTSIPGQGTTVQVVLKVKAKVWEG